MCDTLAATASTTARGAMLFGKNSDRERNEAQALELLPRRRHAAGSRLQLTYIDIAQVAETNACLISRPFWMWGAEMGANDHGVVIGNEAMHALVPAERKRALTGMDLVRLGLERAKTAEEAVQVMTALLEQHGQGGDCGHLNRFYYHNGFVIADPHEAFILETVGRWWIAERVQGVRTLSNALSIGRAPHAISADLKAQAKAQGWLDGHGDFHFSDRLIDPVKDAASFGRGRCARARSLLKPLVGQIELADVQAVLRDHGEDADGDCDWSPRKTISRSICMHAAEGARRSQTVASMASDLTPGRIVHWVTGTAAPCLSLFKPVVLGVGPNEFGATPTDRFDDRSLWWMHERLHREALHNFPDALALIAQQRDDLEAVFRALMDHAWAGGEDSIRSAIELCWREAAFAEDEWRSGIAALKRRGSSAIGRPAALAWARLNTAAGFPGR